MRNPNNKLLPNLWTAEPQAAHKFLRLCRENGLLDDYSEPRKWLGHAETYYLAAKLAECREILTIASRENSEPRNENIKP